MKRFLKRLFFIGVLAITAAGVYISLHPVPPVLTFHYFGEAKDATVVSPEKFTRLLDQINRSEKPVRLTCDGATSRTFSVFFEELRARNMKGTLFVVTSEIGQEGMLTWDQIREMDRAGFSIGSHSVSHPWLPDLTDEEIRRELNLSKKIIEKEIGHPITEFAYPYGAFDEKVKRLVKEAGYEKAFATTPGRKIADDDPLAVKRVTLNRLALSNYYIPARELIQAFIPVEIPRKPAEWSYKNWNKVSGI